MKIALLCFMCIFIISCNTEELLKDNDIENIYSGLDINGQDRSCKKISDDTACTTEFTNEDQFALDCRENGDIAVACACHDYICVKERNTENIIYGFDINGSERSCTPLPQDTACTTVFTQDDQYAIDCRNNGGSAIACSCHDFICTKKIEF